MGAKKLRLLIVDDLETWRFTLKEILADREDIHIAEAGSGEEAVAKVQAEDYDLVLLDMRMPSGTEGLDALVEIKRVKSQTQVIIVSAYGDIPKAVEAMKRGAFDFLPKEENLKEQIVFRVEEFIRRTQLIEDRERLIQAKYEEAGRAKSKQKKGKALEDLIAALFASVEGFSVIDRNVYTATEEIDLVIRNSSREPVWRRESEIILVECKNWRSQRVGKNEFVVFKEKIENRAGRCKLGFLICTERFAETVEKEMLRSSKSNLLIVPIDGDDLRKLVEAKNRSEILRSFVDCALLK
ncbi:MAG: YraN family protein [Blastocatellia bacterium]